MTCLHLYRLLAGLALRGEQKDSHHARNNALCHILIVVVCGVRDVEYDTVVNYSWRAVRCITFTPAPAPSPRGSTSLE